jgi:osmotically-inducible protein OsmY
MLKKSILCIPLFLSGCVAPVAFGGMSAVGTTAVEERGIGGYASDQALRVKVNWELSNKLDDFAGIELTVYKARVLLTGVAASEQIKQQAVQVTKTVPGVKEVIDGMNVEGEDGFAEYSRDAWMTTKLKATLYTDQDIEAPNYLVRTFDKVIYIFGTALTKEEMQKVIDYAYDITGVRKVVNLIEVILVIPAKAETQ